MTWKTSVELLLIIGMTLLVYVPIHEAGFILDDKKFYIDDPLMSAPDGWRRIWLNPSENNKVWPYLPLTRTSFWLERQLFALDLRVTHWLNVAFHLVGTLLFWRTLQYFRFRGAWGIALLFALHPVHVQSVAWIAERKNVVSVIFYVLVFWSYFHFEKKGLWRWYTVALILFAGALLSKTSTIMLPIVLILARVWLQSPWRKMDLIALLPFFGIASMAGIFRVWFELNFFGTSNEIYNLPFSERLLVAAHVPFFYLKKLILPYPLMFHYPKWQFELTTASVYLPVVSLLLAGGFLLYKYRSWGNHMLIGLAMFLATLFPVMGFFKNAFTQYSFVADHWLYLPSIPVLTLMGSALLKSTEGIKLQNPALTRWLPLFLGMSILGGLGTLTWKQVSTYQTYDKFWQTLIDKNPHSWLGHYNLGLSYLINQQPLRSIAHFDQAIQNEPELFQAYESRGNAYTLLKEYERALEDYNQAITIEPQYAQSYANQGVAYFHLQKRTLACQAWKHACQLGHCTAYRSAQTENYCL